MLLNENAASYTAFRKIKNRSADLKEHLEGPNVSIDKREREFKLQFSSQGSVVCDIFGHYDFDMLHLEKFKINGGAAGVHQFGETIVNRLIKTVQTEHQDIGQILIYVDKEDFNIVTLLLDFNFDVRETRFDSMVLVYSLPNPKINREDNLVSRVYQWL